MSRLGTQIKDKYILHIQGPLYAPKHFFAQRSVNIDICIEYYCPICVRVTVLRSRWKIAMHEGVVGHQVPLHDNAHTDTLL